MSDTERQILKEVAVILTHLVLPTYEELLQVTGRTTETYLAEAA